MDSSWNAPPMLELLAKMGKETVEMDVSGPDMAGLRGGYPAARKRLLG